MKHAHAEVTSRLFRAALAPELDARAAWSSVSQTLDLADRSLANADLLALLSERLGSWGLDDPRLSLLTGARRHNWAQGATSLSELARHYRGTDTGPVLLGRAATVAAYQPAPGLVSLVRPKVASAHRGPLMEVDVAGVTMRVPAPPRQLVWALRHRLWIDAVFALRHPAMRWEELSADSGLRRRPSIHAGLVTLRELIGAEIPEPVIASVTPPLLLRALGPLTARSGRALHWVASKLESLPRRPARSNQTVST